MIKLIYTEQALLDLERPSAFLPETDPQARFNTAALIFDALDVLVQHPEIGRKAHFGQRELVISRGEAAIWLSIGFAPYRPISWPSPGAGNTPSTGVWLQECCNLNSYLLWLRERACRGLAGLEILMGFGLQTPFSQPVEA